MVVLEADYRVGGRGAARRLAGHVIDRGGQRVAPTQANLLALAEEFGVKTYPQYMEGENILDVVGREARYKEGEDLPLEPADLEEFGRLMGELEAVAAKLDVAAPWAVAGADGLDAQTFESWLLGATASEPARSLFRLIAQVVFCVEPGQLSPLNLLHYAAAGEGIAHMIGTRGGAQDEPVRGRRLAAGREDGRGDWATRS